AFSGLLERIGELFLQESKSTAGRRALGTTFSMPLHGLQAWRACYGARSALLFGVERTEAMSICRAGCYRSIPTRRRSSGVSNARTFARKAVDVSSLSYAQLLAWLDRKGR